MESTTTFDRCVYCFSAKNTGEECPRCGYSVELCEQPGWWLPPGTVLKGRYLVGKNRDSNPHWIRYLGWDLERSRTVDITEYFPAGLVTRDITSSNDVVTVPGCKDRVEKGQQTFLEKAKLFYDCVHGVEKDTVMDFFLRNNTCYYALHRQERETK